VTPQQIALVQSTFDRATRISPHLVATFYAELFAIEPPLRAMFTGDMIRQGQRLMGALSTIVGSIADPDKMAPALRDLAMRHVGYGVEPRHYTLVGVALIRTLKHELGRDFTYEAREAWSIAYKRVSDIMIEAAYGKDALSASGQAASPRR